MRCFVVIETEVPDDVISEQLDLVTGAWDRAKLAIAQSTSPCAYDAPVKFVYEGEVFRALLLL